MPKELFIDPSVVRKAGEITLKPIPVNTYNKTIRDEQKNFTNAELIRIYHDMVVIREFETMLNLIKTTGEYNGVAYDHPGPAHLSIGQEASAVDGWRPAAIAPARMPGNTGGYCVCGGVAGSYSVRNACCSSRDRPSER
jgi:hypothetical protein